jgi:eukaryotic-like serine/threonine-protein kinase
MPSSKSTDHIPDGLDPDSDNHRDDTVVPEIELPPAGASRTGTWLPENQEPPTLPAGNPPTEEAVEDLPSALRNHPRYRVIRRIGRGGMGEVYAAEHRMMGRIVALKTIRVDFVSKPDLVERFQREVRASAKLSHPNVVAVYDAENSAHIFFLAMEYLQGEDLRDLVRREGPLNVPTACTLLQQATAGVKHAHDRGVIHRDIKPTNLFLVGGEERATSGVVKVLDFGLAKMLLDAGVLQYGTPTGYAMGTRGYIAPEQEADARSVGIQADIFSLGRTLYFLLSGRRPYPDEFRPLREEAGGNPDIPLEQLCPGISNDVVRLIDKMTARRSEDRFQSCADVLTALAPLCGG